MSHPCPIFKNGVYSSRVAFNIRKHLLEKYNIRIRGKAFKTAVGRTVLEERAIWVPNLSTPDRFMVTLHEIGHLVVGWSNQIHYAEFKAEKWALNFAKKVGFPAEELRRYEHRARGYILWWIASEYSEGMKVSAIKPNVKKWIKYDFKKWRKKKVWVNNYWHKTTGHVILQGQYGRCKTEPIYFG